MPISRVQQLVQTGYDGGQSWTSSFRKVSAIGSTQGIWADLSLAPGSPKPNYYVGGELAATQLNDKDGANGVGLWHGGNVAPKTKHLHTLLISSTVATPTPNTFYLCDYLLFYPLIDMDATGQQLLINTATLPRYTDGVGVRAFLVATNPFLGGAQFTMTYTNSAGVSGREMPLLTSDTNTFIGTLVHGGTNIRASGPFLPLCEDDLGVRSVQSIEFLAPNGGLAALVLCKPLAVVMTAEVTACAEFDFLTMKPTLPRIMDGAYLNFLCCPNGSLSGAPITGMLTTVWV